LIKSTLQQATLSPAISAGVQALADGVTQAMFLSKIKTVAAGVLMAGAIGTGTGVALFPGGGPDQVVASEPSKGVGPGKEAPKEDGLNKFLNSLNGKANLNEVIAVWTENERTKLKLRIELLRNEARRDAELVRNGALPKEASRTKELKEEIAKAESELKKLGGEPDNVADKQLRQSELEMMKDRLSYEERMVKKGYLPASAPLATKREIARLEEELKKLAAPKAPDPRLAAMEALIQKMEEIVAITADGVKKGVVPQQELLNAEQRLLDLKFKVLVSARPSTTDPTRADAEKRAAYEETIRKLEMIVTQTAEGVKKGIIPKMELLNAEATLLHYKFQLAELTVSAPAHPKGEDRLTAIALREIAVRQKEANLKRAEVLYKQKVVSLEELQQIRIELAQSRAELSTAEGDHGAAVSHRDAVVKELEDVLRDTKSLFERKVASAESVRKAEAALAEAKIAAMQGGIRKQLADLVNIREQDLKSAKAMFDAKVASVEELRKAEQALAEAKLRLAEGR
jgi:multidrug resistance efflux pump